MRAKLIEFSVAIILCAAVGMIGAVVLKGPPILKSTWIGQLDDKQSDYLVKVPNAESIFLLIGFESETPVPLVGNYSVRDEAGNEEMFMIARTPVQANWLGREGISAILITSDEDYVRLKRLLVPGADCSISLRFDSPPSVPRSLWLFYTQK